MKKFNLMATMLAASLGMTFSGVAFADEISGAYVQADLGLAHIRADTKREWNSGSDIRNNLKSSYKDAGLMPRISGGYDFGDWRLAADYTHYNKLKESSGSAQTSTQVRGVGVSAIYDLPLTSYPIQPYVGARLAANKIKQSSSGLNSSVSVDETKLSPGFLVGANYQLGRNLTLDSGYRYNHFDSNVKAHELSVGLRYTFR